MGYAVVLFVGYLHDQCMSLFHFLHGRNPRPLDVVCTYLAAILIGLLVLWAKEPLDWRDWILSVLAADIAGGIVSNATEATRLQWRMQPVWMRRLFLVQHLIALPTAVLLITGPTDVVGAALVLGLVLKVLLFAAGQSTGHLQSPPK
jgi:hypothetical protein